MAFGSQQWMYKSGEAFTIDQSLKSSRGGPNNLSRTPTTGGHRQKWVFSCWIKRSQVSGNTEAIFSTPGDYIVFNSGSKLNWAFNTESDGNLVTTQVFRDPNAWMHLLFVHDTTQATASNRALIYVNGVRVTDFTTETYPAEDRNGNFNHTNEHNLIEYQAYNEHGLNGYISEVHFIDKDGSGSEWFTANNGTASSSFNINTFGEFGDYGEWKPKEVTGVSYGTNGFYLPFKQDYTVEGFSATTYGGTGVTQHIGGVGFQPDLVWIKNRGTTDHHKLADSVRGVQKDLHSNLADGEYTNTDTLSAFNTDGFSVGNNSATGASGGSYVAWCWDMGGTTVTNTTGSISAQVRANSTYGQSIITYTASYSGQPSIGHGLSSAPEMIIFKSRTQSMDWHVYHKDLTDGNEGVIKLNTDAAQVINNNYLDHQDPTSSIIYLPEDGNGATNEEGHTNLAYCFHSVTGYSSIGSYTGNGSATGTVVTFASGGFKPAFVLIKPASAADHWMIYDSTRSPTNPRNDILFPNRTNAESVDHSQAVDFLSNGFQLKSNNTGSNGNGTTYIYMAFADKREYAYWLDQSGNNNDWTSNNLTESDIMLDSPTNNFCTLNPLEGTRSTTGTRTYSEGNLQLVTPQGENGNTFSTMGVTSGKWYAEFLYKATNGLHRPTIGVTGDRLATLSANANIGGLSGARDVAYMGNDGDKNVSGSESSYGSAFSIGDIIGVVLDVDNDTVNFYHNNVAKGNITIASTGTWHIGCGDVSGGATATIVANFGQDSSFAGNKPAQGNQDSNDIGDFYYTPPTGFLALCTSNLPDVAVIPSEHFNTILWTGNDTDDRSITGVGFQPDWTWNKRRNHTASHMSYDAVRGATKNLLVNATNAENTEANAVQAFESDGFQVGDDGNSNSSSYNFVAWNWKAGGSGSANTTGSINSTVSANTDAGFSIVSYTGNATNAATIGHGLSKAPEMVIIKNRDRTSGWRVGGAKIGNGSTQYLSLHSTAALDNASTGFQAFTSTTFQIGNDTDWNASGEDIIAYCFHSVDGYSKVGTYTGNANADGTFVYTGFRPMWIMTKSTERTEWWRIRDTVRDTNNPLNVLLEVNTGAEQTSGGVDIDILSNGFKLRSSDSGVNANGEDWIYIAFAETPFKYSNAR